MSINQSNNNATPLATPATSSSAASDSKQTRVSLLGRDPLTISDLLLLFQSGVESYSDNLSVVKKRKIHDFKNGLEKSNMLMAKLLELKAIEKNYTNLLLLDTYLGIGNYLWEDITKVLKQCDHLTHITSQGKWRHNNRRGIERALFDTFLKNLKVNVLALKIEYGNVQMEILLDSLLDERNTSTPPSSL